MTAAEMNEELKKGVLTLDAGTYRLDQPLKVRSGSGIVGEKGVVLEVNGNFTGIIVEGEGVVLSDFVVKVNTVDYKYHVIFVKDSVDVEAQRVKVSSRYATHNAGICFFRCRDVKALDCTFDHLRFGTFITTGVERGRISGCDVYNCKTGIYVYGREATCEGIYVTDCTITSYRGKGESGCDGILVDGGWRVYILGNRCVTNMEHGIYIAETNLGVISENWCLDNTVNGIQVIGSRRTIVEGNTCSYNNGNGIYLDRCEECLIARNTCFENDRWGILEVHRSDSNVFTENSSLGNEIGSLHRG